MSTNKIYDNDNTKNKMLPQIFNFEGSQVRIIIDEKGEAWFATNDIASILGYNNTGHAARMLEDDERGFRIVDTLGGPQKLGFINESGLYSLIFGSRKVEARKFKKWVTSEVLPTIRKTGSYGQPIDFNNTKLIHKLLINYTDKINNLEYQVEIDKPKVTFYDKFINSDGMYNLQNAARALDLQPNLFIDSLKNHYLFYQGRALVPYQRYIQQELFVVKSNVIDNKVRCQTCITSKGLQYFAERYYFLNAS